MHGEAAITQTLFTEIRGRFNTKSVYAGIQQSRVEGTQKYSCPETPMVVDQKG